MGEASKSGKWSALAIKVASAGLGVAVAGPVGGAIGGFLGDALGAAASELLKTSLEKFGEEAGKKLLDSGGESLVARLGKRKPEIESVYRESLRRSLRTIGEQHRWDGYQEWFDNWERRLEGGGELGLPAVTPEQLQQPDALFRSTMECLAAQGAAKRSFFGFFHKIIPSILLDTRPMPEELYALLTEDLPPLLQKNFSELIVEDDNDRAWKQLELTFRDYVREKLDAIKDDTTQIKGDTREILEILRKTVAVAEKENRLTAAEARAATAESAAEEWKKKYLLLEQQAEPSLQKLLAIGDLNTAARKKTEQISQQHGALATNYFELGNIQELRFDWPSGLAAYREAWRLERNPEYGFKYAYAAQHQNQFEEAIRTYEAVRSLYRGPANVAVTLNNLGNLYSATQRIDEAEAAYAEALKIRRKLAEANPGAYLPDLATTLNNLAVLYRATQRMGEAETAHAEALKIRRKLAEANPVAYLPDVAMTLNNLAILYSATQRMGEAETAFAEALKIRRKLAEANPEAYLPDVAMTLNNRAILYSDTQRMGEARACCGEAEVILLPLWNANPSVHGDQMAKIWCLGALIGEMLDQPREELCGLARRAVAAAHDPIMKQGAQGLVEKYCG